MSYWTEEHELGEWIVMALDLIPPHTCGHEYGFEDVVTEDHSGGFLVAGISSRQYLGFRCPRDNDVWSFKNVFTAHENGAF